MSRLFCLFLTACAANADTPTVRQECTSFPVRSTIAMGPFMAPQDLANAKVNATTLPAGWTVVGGNVGEGGTYIVACRDVAGP